MLHTDLLSTFNISKIGVDFVLQFLQFLSYSSYSQHGLNCVTQYCFQCYSFNDEIFYIIIILFYIQYICTPFLPNITPQCC